MPDEEERSSGDPLSARLWGQPRKIIIGVVVGGIAVLAGLLWVARSQPSFAERIEQADTCVELAELDEEYGREFDGPIVSNDELADIGAGRGEPSEESIAALKAAIDLSIRGGELGCPGYDG